MFFLATILDAIQRFVHAGGYYVIFGLLFACGLGLPLPEDIPLLLGGYFSATGHLDVAVVAIVAWFGIIGGDCVLYHFGKKYGLNITRVPYIGKHVTKEGIQKAEVLFDRWGIWVVGVGRMLAGIRGMMVVAAGTIRYNFVKFLIADGLGAIVSGGIFLGLGYWAGKKFGDLNALRAKIRHWEHWIFGGLILIGIVIVAVAWYRKKKQKPHLADVALGKAAEKAVEHPIKKPKDASTSSEPEPEDNKAAPSRSESQPEENNEVYAGPERTREGPDR